MFFGTNFDNDVYIVAVFVKNPTPPSEIPLSP